jgi:hypothetical protein
MFYLKARAIAALLGKDSDTIYRVARLENWRKASRQGVNSTYFAIEDAERTFGTKFSDGQIRLANEEYSNPAVISVLEETEHV